MRKLVNSVLPSLSQWPWAFSSRMCPLPQAQEGMFCNNLLGMAKAGLDRASSSVLPIWICGSGRNVIWPLGVVGLRLLICDPGVSLGLLDDPCQWRRAPHIIHLGLALFSSLIQERLCCVVPASWDREGILIRLHPPPQCFLLLRTLFRIVPLQCSLQEGTLIQSHSFSSPAQALGVWGRQVSGGA